MNQTPPKPSVAEVSSYLQQDAKSAHYHLQIESLQWLLHALPTNTNLRDIFLKVSTINHFYSTNILKTYTVATHIAAIADIDARLQAGDPTLVADIGKVTFENEKTGASKTINFYSFASKYCSCHNRAAFPIYDSYVDKMLRYFQKTYRFSKFKRADLKDYATFKRILADFQAFFGLQAFNLWQLDQYLWLAGKKYYQAGKYTQGDA